MWRRFSKHSAVVLVGVISAVSFFHTSVLADIGVGVGTGKIEISEIIKPGGIYTLPDITVYNTGDVKATYAMHLTLNETQDQLKPSPDWFSFEPSSFELEPGKARQVTPILKAPLKIQSGEYFGYLEAYPDSTVEQSGASIGVAAATKLSFVAKNSNILDSLYNRARSLYLQYSPWSYVATIALTLFAIALIIRKYLRFNIKITKATKPNKNSQDKIDE